LEGFRLIVNIIQNNRPNYGHKNARLECKKKTPASLFYQRKTLPAEDVYLRMETQMKDEIHFSILMANGLGSNELFFASF